MFFSCGNPYKVFELHLCPIDLLLFSMRFFLLCGQLLSRHNRTSHITDAPRSMRHEPVSTSASTPMEPCPIQRHASPCAALFGFVPQRSCTIRPHCQRGADHGSGGIGWGGSSARGGLQTGEGVLHTPPLRKRRGFVEPPGALLSGFQWADPSRQKFHPENRFPPSQGCALRKLHPEYLGELFQHRPLLRRSATQYKSHGTYRTPLMKAFALNRRTTRFGAPSSRGTEHLRHHAGHGSSIHPFIRIRGTIPGSVVGPRGTDHRRVQLNHSTH